MSEKRKKSVTSVFIVTFLSVLVLLGSTSVLLLNFLLDGKLHPKASEPVQAVENNYIPEADKAQTILFILDSGKEKNEKLFLLTRFLPEKDSLLLIPISGDTYAQINTKKSTVYEFYRTGGVLSAAEAVQAAYNIPVERYARLDKKAFYSLVETFGGVTYTIPYDMSYENSATGEQTRLYEGEQLLDGNMLRKLLTFPELKEGEEYRPKLLAVTVSKMLDAGIDDRLCDNLDAYFNNFVNSAETNITATDYNYRKEAMLFVMKNTEFSPEFKIPAGSYNESGQFVPDSTFKDNLLSWFEVKPVIT